RVEVFDAGVSLGTGEQVVPVLPAHSIAYDEVEPFTLTFTAQASSRPAWLDEAGCHWDFGAGTVASGASVAHTFRHKGVHTVLLSVSIAGVTFGCGSEQVDVSAAAEPLAPVALAGPDLTVRDEDNDGVERVVLNALRSYDPDGAIVRYRWTRG